MTANADTMAGIPTTIHDSSYDLVEHMRRLSDASDGSSYSVVSNPSTYSFGTDASFAGGITVGTANIEALEAGIQAVTLSDRDTKAETRPDHGVGSTKSDKKKSPPKAKSTKPKSAFAPVSPFWLNFPGFVPDPKARFKAEFARLAGHQGWGKKRKRKYEVEALSAEATAFYGTCETRLDHWHQLCEDVGIEPVPKSITQCRKALTSRSVYVNLYNLIDHRRNPDVEVKRFESYGAFSKYTKAGRTFPRAIAKQDGVIKVLLKKL
ncbi:hypothetical protein GQ44DRAFT_697831 [Phaeosphaeriaceae sp. PMI808]|nr:hypothetical protein GQ44DRAFT_697831 [Phaeosphaeriaceae sp. PMI808]